MTELHRARFVRSLTRNSVRQHLTHSTQTNMTKGVVMIIQRDDLTVVRARAFGHHNYRVTRLSMNEARLAHALVQELKDPLIAKRILRDKHDVRLPGNTGPERQVAGMPPHNLNYLHPAVRACRRARAFDDLGDIPKCRVESERVVSAGEIFVDGLGHADDVHSHGCELCRDTQSVFAAANHQRVKPEFFDVREHFGRTILLLAGMATIPER